jgi:hypothetical protein
MTARPFDVRVVFGLSRIGARRRRRGSPVRPRSRASGLGRPRRERDLPRRTHPPSARPPPRARPGGRPRGFGDLDAVPEHRGEVPHDGDADEHDRANADPPSPSRPADGHGTSRPAPPRVSTRQVWIGPDPRPSLGVEQHPTGPRGQRRLLHRAGRHRRHRRLGQRGGDPVPPRRGHRGTRWPRPLTSLRSVLPDPPDRLLAALLVRAPVERGTARPQHERQPLTRPSSVPIRTRHTHRPIRTVTYINTSSNLPHEAPTITPYWTEVPDRATIRDRARKPPRRNHGPRLSPTRCHTVARLRRHNSSTLRTRCDATPEPLRQPDDPAAQRSGPAGARDGHDAWLGFVSTTINSPLATNEVPTQVQRFVRSSSRTALVVRMAR